MKCHRSSRCGARRCERLLVPCFQDHTWQGCSNTCSPGSFFCDTTHRHLHEEFLEALRRTGESARASGTAQDKKRRFALGEQIAVKAARGDFTQGSGLTPDEWGMVNASCATCVKESASQLATTRTAGLLAACTPCGLVCGWSELQDTESHRARLNLVCKRVSLNPSFKICIHDDACHMQQICISRRRRFDLSDPAQRRLRARTWVLDRLRAKNHTGQWCRANVWPDLPHLRPLVEGVNTQICEQIFSWLVRLKHAFLHMNKSTYRLFMTAQLQLHNEVRPLRWYLRSRDSFFPSTPQRIWRTPSSTTSAEGCGLRNLVMQLILSHGRL